MPGSAWVWTAGFSNGALDFKNVFLTCADGYTMAKSDEKRIDKSLWEEISGLDKYRNQCSDGRIFFTHNNKQYEGSLYIIEGLDWKVWTCEDVDIIHQNSDKNLLHSIIAAVVALVLSVLMLSALRVNFLVSRLVFKPLGKCVVLPPLRVAPCIRQARPARGSLCIWAGPTGLFRP